MFQFKVAPFESKDAGKSLRLNEFRVFRPFLGLGVSFGGLELEVFYKAGGPEAPLVASTW